MNKAISPTEAPTTDINDGVLICLLVIKRKIKDIRKKSITSLIHGKNYFRLYFWIILHFINFLIQIIQPIGIINFYTL